MYSDVVLVFLSVRLVNCGRPRVLKKMRRVSRPFGGFVSLTFCNVLLLPPLAPERYMSNLFCVRVPTGVASSGGCKIFAEVKALVDLFSFIV